MPFNMPFMNTRNPQASLSFKLVSKEQVDELNTMLDARVKERKPIMDECQKIISEYCL